MPDNQVEIPIAVEIGQGGNCVLPNGKDLTGFGSPTGSARRSLIRINQYATVPGTHKKIQSAVAGDVGQSGRSPLASVNSGVADSNELPVRDFPGPDVSVKCQGAFFFSHQEIQIPVSVQICQRRVGPVEASQVEAGGLIPPIGPRKDAGPLALNLDRSHGTRQGPGGSHVIARVGFVIDKVVDSARGCEGKAF